MDFEHHRDQRKSYRCAVAKPHQNCDFKVGDGTTSAILLDESAGGFSVLIPQPPDIDLTIDQTAQIRTNAGWSNVRIVHIKKILPPQKAATEAETETVDMEPGPWLRLGLRRLDDTGLPEWSMVSLLAESLRYRLGKWRSSGMMLILSLGLFVAVIAVAVPLAMMKTGWRIGLPLTDRVPQSDKRQADSDARRPSPIETSKPPAVRSVGSGVKHHADAAYQPDGGSSLTKSEQFHLMLQLPGASPLILPEVITRLQLTAEQQKRINQLIETTSEAVRILAEQFPGMKRHEISQRREELLDQARRDALELLNEQQRAEWKKLSNGRQ